MLLNLFNLFAHESPIMCLLKLGSHAAVVVSIFPFFHHILMFSHLPDSSISQFEILPVVSPIINVITPPHGIFDSVFLADLG